MTLRVYFDQILEYPDGEQECSHEKHVDDNGNSAHLFSFQLDVFKRCIKLNNLIWTFHDREQEKGIRSVTDDVFESLFVLDDRSNSLIGSDGVIDALCSISFTAVFILISFWAAWNGLGFFFFQYNFIYIVIFNLDVELGVFIRLLGNVYVPDHWDRHYLKSNTDFLTTFFWPVHISNEHVASFLSETELFELLLNYIMIIRIVLLETFYIAFVIQIQF